MDKLNEFILVLNDECDALKKEGLMPNEVSEPWRYYSPPVEGEHEFEQLRAVLEAGKYAVQAEEYAAAGEDLGAWRELAKAQGALLKLFSLHGRKEAKKLGNSKGGKAKAEGVHYKIFCIADDLLADGHVERGLARKVSEKLSELHNIEKNENQVRVILKKQNHMLVNR